MSDDLSPLLIGLALCSPFFLTAPALLARRSIGIAIAFLGTVAGCLVFFGATRPDQHGGPLAFYDKIGYMLQCGYGALLMVVYGLILLTRIGFAVWDAYRPCPEVRPKKEQIVAAGADLPHASVEAETE